MERLTVRKRRFVLGGFLLAIGLLSGCINPLAQDPSPWAGSGGWSYVGAPAFTSNAIAAPKIAFQPGTGTPYVAIYDWSVTRGTLWQYAGQKWTQVGGPFTAGDLGYMDFAFDPTTGYPVVAYADATTTPPSRLSAQSYDGTSWSYIGGAGFGFSPSPVIDTIAVAVNSAGNVLVAFPDQGSTPADRLSVMESSTNWGYFPGGFGQDVSGNGAWQITMNVDASGSVSVAFDDDTYFRASMLHNISTGWSPTGLPGFSPGSVGYLRSAVSKSLDQYVVFEDGNSGGAATVMKYSSGVWSLVGPEGFTSSSVTNTWIAVDSKGVPYVAFFDGSQGTRVTVMKFNGSAWKTVGRQGFVAAGSLAFAVGPDDTPYIAFSDPANGYHLSVMAYH